MIAIFCPTRGSYLSVCHCRPKTSLIVSQSDECCLDNGYPRWNSTEFCLSCCDSQTEPREKSPIHIIRRVVKERVFYGQADCKHCPPPLQSALCDFFLVYFWPFIMIICVQKLILHKKKSISVQLLGSPIPPLNDAALQMFICKRQPRRGHEKCQTIKFQWKKDQNFHIC